MEKIFPSLVAVLTYRLSYQSLTKENLAKMTDSVREAIGMRALGKMTIDELPSEIAGFNAFSVNQPLMTSIMSTDSWPETKAGNVVGGFVILVHSCQRFKWQDVDKGVKDIFPSAELLHKNFKDNTCRGISLKLTLTKLWLLNLFRRKLRRSAVANPRIA